MNLLQASGDGITLRPYQEYVVDACRSAFRRGRRRLLISAPTGSGKTVMAAKLIELALEKGSRVFFVADRIALVQQASDVLTHYGIQHGILQGANTRNTYENVLVCSTQTLARHKTKPPDMLIIDEAHTLYAKTVDLIMNSQARTIGLTATPLTAGLGDTYQENHQRQDH